MAWTTTETRTIGETTILLESQAGAHRLRIPVDDPDPDITGDPVHVSRAATLTVGDANFVGIGHIQKRRLNLDFHIMLVDEGEEA